ncbi:MAG TPA: SAF domain-containing protein [Acidimicrobiia bacterium]|nr:SAF domain-containing protein [Acidimicrobiia bacterium]
MTSSPSTKAREAGSPSPARRSIGRRLSATHVLIAIVVILAFVLNLLVLRDRSSTTLVAVADRPLSTGSVLSGDSVRLVPVDSDFEAISRMVTEDDIARYIGWVVGRHLAEGEVVGVSALVQPGEGPGLRSMSLPVPIERAAGGSLVAGDRVDVISVTDSRARFVASDLEVTGVAEIASGGIGMAGSYHIVVAVTAEQALALATALDSGSLEVVRSTGAGLVRSGSDDG